MTGRAALAGQFEGRTKGNFRAKALKEGCGKLIHNRESNLPGQVGMSADKMPAQMQAKAGQVDMDKAERDIRRKEGIIQSMTPLERRKPELLKATRKRRIAAGAGVQVQDVNRLLNEFEQMQTMMKKMRGGGLMKMMKRMGGGKGMPKMPF